MVADDEENEERQQSQRPETDELVAGPMGELGIRTRKPANPWVSVYVSDPELLELAKKKGINRSRLFTEALRIALYQGERSLVALMELEETRDQVLRLRKRIADLKEEIRANEEYLERVERHLAELEEQERLVRRANRLSELFIALNKVCVDSGFDRVAVEQSAGEVIEEIRKEFEDFHLEKHLVRLKEYMRPWD